jgi:hypothetical protein
VIPGCENESVPKSQVLLKPGTSKIEVPVPEPQLLSGKLLVQGMIDWNHRRRCLIEQLEAMRPDLNLSRSNLGVTGGFWAERDLSLHPNHIFAA